MLTGVPLRSSGCEELCHSALSSQVLPELALPKSYPFGSLQRPRIDDTGARWRFGSVSHRVKDFPTRDQDFWRDLRLATPFRLAATIELWLAKGTASLEDGHLGHLVSGLLNARQRAGRTRTFSERRRDADDAPRNSRIGVVACNDTWCFLRNCSHFSYRSGQSELRFHWSFLVI